ncbi:peptidase domain-containing ABC transporter [Fulvivirgaceae bacterium BMA12]|uniref:Peptidase domain-containing ABC transporter n=1 Tax=Agaribacillus aureus TaxID=3051825 RepID=A0ABT8L018_9BACT|nr:peptidase domain-containing ABC transporter [Fulvivirgaceae bacterium BMA12]
MTKRFPLFTQHDSMDCGPTCIRMIAKSYGKNYSLEYLKRRSYFTREGVSLAGISEAAETIGFRTLAVKTTLENLAKEAPLPCIVHWQQQHFVVVYKIDKKKVWIADPVGQRITLSHDEFLRSWAFMTDRDEKLGIVLLFETTPDFYSRERDEQTSQKKRITHLFSYFHQYKSFIWQLILGLLAGSLVQLSLPFLTQAVVDVGINTQNLNFIYIILAAQLMLVFSRTAVDFIRRWILLHLSTRVNIGMISDFLIKIMLAPLSFFDSRMIGDILQRIGDHTRIQNFLSSSSLNILFSFFNLLVFGAILLFYDISIFLIFFIGSAIYFLYVIQFLKKREELDYKLFNQQSTNQSTLIQLITGIAEIKLNGAEKTKRWEWERIQAKLFKVKVASTSLQQWQESGSVFINELKNIVVTILAAKAVIDGEMTLGMMLAVQYIIGQLNAPINDIILFLREWQDAKISLERVGQVYEQENEETQHADYSLILPAHRSIKVKNLSFRYDGGRGDLALDDVSFDIPEGKVTAIVGMSGSGKTTLLKLLLKFYQPTAGKITVGGMDLQAIHSKRWRSLCGAVMQDGFIFSDTIASNIAVGEDIEYHDQQRLKKVSELANISSFVEELPLGFNTKIGQEGIGMSQGQQQRLLIARAIYKEPEFLFFDEATSSLDANNETEIMRNLEQVFAGRTVLVIAHRLSTVKNADQIIVMDKGSIVELGNHHSLIRQQGNYYYLVKNQLELDK